MNEIICIGEVLWDSLPSGLFPGGASYNVANMLHQLGVPSFLVSRIGEDKSGSDLINLINSIGVDTTGIQHDPENITGLVDVKLDMDNEPDYDIKSPAAWDFIEYNDDLRERSAKAGAIVFGSLAQRNASSRKTIQKLLDTKVLKIFDINLRHPFIEINHIEYSLKKADILKLNSDELDQLKKWFNIPGNENESLRKIMQIYDYVAVYLTRGEQGAKLLYEDRLFFHSGYKIELDDPVGAGDAFLAAAIKTFLAGESGEVILRYANAVAAFVASKKGATPDLDFGEIQELLSRSQKNSKIE